LKIFIAFNPGLLVVRQSASKIKKFMKLFY